MSNGDSGSRPSNDQSPLPRYGLRWNGPAESVSTEMPDGYWTPWHLAERQRLFDQKEIERLTRERDEAIALGLDHAATLIENRYLRAALEEIGGYDCDNYCKHLSPQPCGKCLPCIARNALSGEHPPSETTAIPQARPEVDPRIAEDVRVHGVGFTMHTRIGSYYIPAEAVSIDRDKIRAAEKAGALPAEVPADHRRGTEPLSRVIADLEMAVSPDLSRSVADRFGLVEKVLRQLKSAENGEPGRS